MKGELPRCYHGSLNRGSALKKRLPQMPMERSMNERPIVKSRGRGGDLPTSVETVMPENEKIHKNRPSVNSTMAK